MFKNQTKVVAFIFVLLVMTSCTRLQPVYNVDESIESIFTKKISSVEVGKIILAAAHEQGWKIKADGVNKYKAFIVWRDHSAVSAITYSSNGYSIRLLSSENLLEGNGQIHKKYNKYVQRLQKNIDTRLAKAGMN